MGTYEIKKDHGFSWNLKKKLRIVSKFSGNVKTFWVYFANIVENYEVLNLLWIKFVENFILKFIRIK